MNIVPTSEFTAKIKKLSSKAYWVKKNFRWNLFAKAFRLRSFSIDIPTVPNTSQQVFPNNIIPPYNLLFQ